MKFSNFIVLSFTLLFLYSCKNTPKTATTEIIPIDGKQVYTDTSSSSVKVFDQNGRVCIQQSNTYYEVTDAYNETEKIPLLLKIKKTELCFADSLNRQKVYEISAKSILDTKLIEWQTQFVATDLQFKDNSLLAVYEGSDNEEDYIKRFSLLTGKEVFACSYGEAKVSIPNVKDKRFIGYTSAKAADKPLQKLNIENLMGVIRYGSSTNPGNSLKLLIKRTPVASKIPTYTPDIVLVPFNGNAVIEDGKQLILMKADEKYTSADVKDFSVKLTFYIGDDNEATQIEIPINNDRLDLKNAKYDKEFFSLSEL